MKWFQLYIFGLLYAVKQQYILNLTNLWLYFVGRGNMATAAFFRDLRAWDWSFFFFLSFSIVIVDSHPLRTLSSCFRDDVVTFFCEGTAHTSTENKHYSCFLFSVILNPISLCSSLNVSDAGISPVFPHSERGLVLSLHSLSWWSHISKRWIHGASSSLHEATCGGNWCFTVRLCFVQLVEFDGFL